MKHNFWTIPVNAMTKEETKVAIANLVMCGYIVKRGKYEDGKYKGIQYIEFWRDEDGEKTSQTERN